MIWLMLEYYVPFGKDCSCSDNLPDLSFCNLVLCTELPDILLEEPLLACLSSLFTHLLPASPPAFYPGTPLSCHSDLQPPLNPLLDAHLLGATTHLLLLAPGSSSWITCLYLCLFHPEPVRNQNRSKTEKPSPRTITEPSFLLSDLDYIYCTNCKISLTVVIIVAALWPNY